jgi:Secretion system C-terminal sorting domain
MKANKQFKVLLLLILSTTAVTSQVLDQSQLLSNSGISARTLDGYRIFQSFTCGITGTLSEIDLGVFNYINGSGTLDIYAGSDNLGTLLQTVPVNISCQSGNCFANFTTSVPVTANEIYTFQFTPGLGIPDPYGVLAQLPGNYSRGEFGLVDPSGTYYPGWDLVFKTFVTSQLGITNLDYDTTALKIYPNPASTSVELRTNHAFTNASVIIFNLFGQPVRQMNNQSGQLISLNCENLTTGVYLIEVIEDEKPSVTSKLMIHN